MKIGLYGGIANNTYVFAKALAKNGIEVCFIRDRGDRYPFSQPIWEDVPCTLNYDEVIKAANWTWEQWTVWETQHGWEAPNWLSDPLKEFKFQGFTFKDAIGPVDESIFKFLARKRAYWHGVLNLMANCDILLVSGIEGSILALASGKPYILWPHGGDIRTAAGLHPPRSLTPSTRVKYLLHLRLLRLAYKKALWIGTHDPKGVGGHIGNITSRFRFQLLGVPLKIRQHLSKPRRHDLLSNLMGRIGVQIPKADWIGFIPSRVDFYWKGNDRLLRALSQVHDKGRLHFIVSGWGANYEDAKKMVSLDHLTFLPCAVSKPILYDFFKAVDFVADQFLMGSYGTTAVEAMSCGTPVMMWIDEEAFRERGWEPPPVLNARNQEDIGKILKDIISGDINLEEQSRAAHDWVKRVHGEESVVPRLVHQFVATLSTVS